MGHGEMLSRRIESGPEFGSELLPSLEDLIDHAPLSIFDYYTEDDLESIGETNPELIDKLTEAYIHAKLGAENA